MISIREVRSAGQAAELVVPRRRAVVGQLGDRVGHGDRVDGHVVEVDPRHRPLGGGPQEGLGQLVGGHARPADRGRGPRSRARARPVRGTDRAACSARTATAVGGGGIGLALEQPGRAGGRAPPSPRAPRRCRCRRDRAAGARDLSSMSGGGDQQELREGVEVERTPDPASFGHEGVHHRGQRDLVQLHLMAVDQVQEQVDGTLEDRAWRPRRSLGTTIPSGPVQSVHLRGRPTMTAHVHEFCPALQPTGDLHLGNYLGAIRNWVADQHDADAYYCVVDLHALTLEHRLRTSCAARTAEAALDLMAAGLDPERCTLFVQSHVAQHTQLAWLLECTATMGELSRMTQFKEKSGPGLGAGRPVHLSGAAGGGHPPLRRRAGPGGRRPAPAPRADPRAGQPVQPPLRTDLGGARGGHPGSGAAGDGPAASRGQDVQVGRLPARDHR